MNRIGPVDQNDHLGGDLYYSTGLSLISPFPQRPNWNLKCQTFINAGQLISIKNGELW